MLQSAARDGLQTRVWIFVIIVLVAGAVFYPVVHGEFLRWDDDINISKNPDLDGSAAQVVKWSLTDTGYLGRYEALTWVSWALIKVAFGLDPFYFHLIVWMFHAINSGLVFLLIRRLFLLSTRPPEADSFKFSICAVMAAAVWAVHPLRVETTAWAVELVFVLPLCFFLLSLLSYLRAAEAAGDRARVWYQTSLLLFTASLAAYPLVLGGFVIYAALDFFPLRRMSLEPVKWFDPSARKLWWQKLPYAGVAIFFGWLNLHVRGHARTDLKPAALADFSILERVMQGCFIWAHNVWKPFVPFHLTPVPAQLVDFNPFAPMFVVSALLVTGLSLLLFLQRRRWPGTLAIWISFLALLVPVLGLSEHPHYSADRYSLVVDIGWSILLAGLLVKVWPGIAARSFLMAVTAVIICGLSFLSRQQLKLWQTNVGFFHGVIKQLENEPKMDFYRLECYERLAAVYSERGDQTAAVETLRSAIRIWPDVIKPYRLLGDAQVKAGDLDAAKISYLMAVRLDSSQLPCLNDLGVAYAQAGKYDEAEAMFAEVLRREPAKESALQNMARALGLQGKTNEAEIYRLKLNTVQTSNSPPVK